LPYDEGHKLLCGELLGLNTMIAISNRNIQFTREDADLLFGKDYSIGKEETVTVYGPKGSLTNVRVMQAVRDATRLEVSKADSYVLGVDAPTWDSWDSEDTPATLVIGPKGHFQLKPQQIKAVDSYQELRNLNKKTVLVLNCGSSSIKYKLIEMPLERVLEEGNIERRSGQSLEEVLQTIFAEAGPSVDIVAHRVVHGADLFRSSVLVTEEVHRQIESISYLAPLHNPINMEGIRLSQLHYRGVPQVAVFDTSFHQTMPPTSYIYSIPYEYYEKHKIRKYGFHGSSHRYVMARAAEMMGRPAESLRLISCHIGNGVSVTAIRNGESYDTSMGLTPLAGVTMGTRSGNIDPAVIPYLERLEGLSTDEIIDILNHRSGLLGISGVSHDIRDLLKRAGEGHPRSQLALDLFISKLHQYIGLYMARLNGADGLIFTAGVGENSAEIREKVCQGLEFAGVYLDSAANRDRTGERFISSDHSPMKVMVIPTNEEIVMARDAYQLAGNVQYKAYAFAGV
jgi:acetate kinase